MTFGLPQDYRPNPPQDNKAQQCYWNARRIRLSRRFQYHVYRLAYRIATERGAQAVADVGCGVATKLMHFFDERFDVTGYDLPEAVEKCHEFHSRGHFESINFEQPVRENRSERTFDLIICADVIEHVSNPVHLLDFLRRISHDRSTLVISTPERIRLHGVDLRSPANPAHVREWTQEEFGQFLTNYGFAIESHQFMPLMRPGWDRETLKRHFFRLIGSDRAFPNQVVVCRQESETGGSGK